MSESPTALDQIAQLQAQIEHLKLGAINELKSKIAETRRTLAEQEAELAGLTGREVAETAPLKRTRRPSVTDEQLKPQVLAVMAADGRNGMNAKGIAEKTGHDAVRIRKFIQENPKFLKRQGSGPGTKFFLP